MPLPLLGLLAVGAASLIGAGAHMNAKDTNKKAQNLLEDAEEIYNEGKSSLMRVQGETEESLLKLGYSKKNILETSVFQFLESYTKIKEVQIKNSAGIEEISNFVIESHEALELQEMSEIYQKVFSKGATGAAAGAVVALAVSGSLPIVTGVLSTAGSLAIAGNIGAAAGLAGSAFSFAATMTPLAAIAAPVLLFTGISSSIKADENLEKAEVTYSQARAAVAEMEVSKTLYIAIAKRADMFDETLLELDKLFSYCTSLLTGVVNKKIGFFKKKIKQRNLTEDEIKLIAITRALAGAVKALIDAPILTEDGQISKQASELHESMAEKIPAFSEAVEEIKKCEFKEAKPLKEKKSKLGIVTILLIIFVSVFLYFKNNNRKQEQNIDKIIDIKENQLQKVETLETLETLEKSPVLQEEEVKFEIKPEVKPEIVAEVKPEVKVQKVQKLPTLKTEKVSNKYRGSERNQFVLVNGKTVFVDENGYITE